MIEFMHEKKILSFFFLVLLSTDEFRIVLLALLFQDRAFSWEAIRYMQKNLLSVSVSQELVRDGLWSDCAEGLSDPCMSGSRKRTLRER